MADEQDTYHTIRALVESGQLQVAHAPDGTLTGVYLSEEALPALAEHDLYTDDLSEGSLLFPSRSHCYGLAVEQLKAAFGGDETSMNIALLDAKEVPDWKSRSSEPAAVAGAATARR